jgi:sulfur-carrier protein
MPLDRADHSRIDIPSGRIAVVVIKDRIRREATCEDESIMVTVLLFGLTLQQSVGESELQLDVTGPVTVKVLLESNQDTLAGTLPFMQKGELLVTVNKKVGSLESMVKDGDVVKLTHQAHPIFDGAMWQNP